MQALKFDTFSLQIDKDGTAVWLDDLQPETDILDVRQELRNNRILHGVNWKTIEGAIVAANNGGKTVSHVQAALGPFLRTTFQFGAGENVNISSNFMELKEELETFSQQLRGEPGEDCTKTGVFISEGNLFLSILKSESYLNVFGEKMDSENPELFFPIDDTIAARATETHFEYYAKKKGYLIKHENGKLGVMDPQIVSADKMLMTYVLAPVKVGMEEAIDHFYDNLISCQNEQGPDLVIPERNKIRKTLNSGKIIKQQLKTGIRAIPGKDAFLDIKIKRNTKRLLLEKDRIDYKNFTPYVEVKKDQLLVEKHLAHRGKNGRDVYGNIIMVEPGKDFAFRAGDGVSVDSEANCIRFTAEIDGIVTLKNDSVMVSKDLKIKGDVSPETGNLKYSRSISIRGSVRSGYSIEGGGDITIEKNVENGAQVNCASNLIINHGILGDRTEVKVKGDAEVGFIENAKVVVQGNLHVKNYIFNGNIFCKGRLLVSGNRLKSNEKGAIIGGRINSMKSMRLHSAGSYANQTELVCGINLEKLELLHRSEHLFGLISRKLVWLQNSINLNLNSPDIHYRLKTLPPAKLQFVKSKLVEIKTTATQREDLIKKITQLKRQVYYPNIQKLRIEITNELVPDVLIRMGKYQKLIKDNRRTTSFFCQFESICHN